jgi:hypothetical protein
MRNLKILVLALAFLELGIQVADRLVPAIYQCAQFPTLAQNVRCTVHDALTGEDL